ncbi:MAG TPA: hypothetical protein VJ549_10240 [Geothrix sp.]|nr:hypothetical protein [Geothrix sp.]
MADHDPLHHYNAIWGSGPDDVWAVGEALIGHWNGTQWSWDPVSINLGGTPTAEDFWSLWGTGPADIWAGCTDITGRFWHYDGTHWSMDSTYNSVSHPFGMWASGSKDFWAVGDPPDGWIMHWDGSAWDGSYLASGLGVSYLDAVWGTGTTDLWAAGGAAAGPGGVGIVCHWDGSAWKKIPTPTATPVLGLWGTGAKDVFAVTAGGGILHWDGSTWSPQASGTTSDLWQISGTGPSDVWAVGDQGTVLHYDGATWRKVDCNTKVLLRGVWTDRRGVAWVAGWGIAFRVSLQGSAG